ncbi:MAG TPA: DUF1398 family protein [Mucilaginibacter sp.]
MFTDRQLKAAHSKIKSGVDFPKYVQEIKNLGLILHEFIVKDGTTIYYSEYRYSTSSLPMYEPLNIANQSSKELLQQAITQHRHGDTDFISFCKQAADAGVENWVIDTQKMVCIYYDLAGTNMITEPIPQLRYA